MAYPSETALTQRETLKAWLDPTVSGNTADSLLDGLVARASSVIVAATNIPVIFDSGQNITEKRNGNGRDRIVTKVAPIVSVTSITITSQSFGGWSSNSIIQPTVIPASDGTSAGFIADDTMIYLIGYTFYRGVQNVSLVYRGGVVLGSTTQQMLEQAALVTAALWWKRRAHIDQASQMSPSGIGTLSFTQKDLPAEAWTIINQIKRVAPVPS